MSIRGATPSSSITPCRFEDSKPKTRSSPPAAAMPSTQKIKRVGVYVLVGAAVAASAGYTANFLMNRGARNPRTVLIEAPAIPAESDNAAAQDPGNESTPAVVEAPKQATAVLAPTPPISQPPVAVPPAAKLGLVPEAPAAAPVQPETTPAPVNVETEPSPAAPSAQPPSPTGRGEITPPARDA